jgi:hypothetical protein
MQPPCRRCVTSAPDARCPSMTTPRPQHDPALLRAPDRAIGLDHLPLASRPRAALPGPARALVGDAEAPEARADRGCADRARQRHGDPLRGLPRAAQPEPRPGQGRRALPPRRDARRSDGAERVDDGEMRRGEPALRRCQGRHPRRPEAAVVERTGAHDAPLHKRDRHHHRPAARHPRARRQHQRPDHGLDDGHVLDEHRHDRHRCRHRQAAAPGRLAGPREGHRPWRVRDRPRSGAANRPEPRRRALPRPNCSCRPAQGWSRCKTIPARS